MGMLSSDCFEFLMKPPKSFTVFGEQDDPLSAKADQEVKLGPPDVDVMRDDDLAMTSKGCG